MAQSRSRGWTALVPLVVIAAFAGVLVLTTGSDESTGDVTPAITLDDVAADAARFDGRQLVLSGTVADAPAAVTKLSKRAFVLTGEDGGRLLVTPLAGRSDRKAGTRLDVRGYVRTADDPAGERAGMLADAGAAAVLDPVRIVKSR